MISTPISRVKLCYNDFLIITKKKMEFLMITNDHFTRTVRKPTNLLCSTVVQCVSQIWASLTCLKFVICRLELIFTTAPAASKNDAHFNQKWSKLTQK